MKVGELYRCTLRTQRTDWYNKLCVYGGEDVINRVDGVKIINHWFLVRGKKRLVDASLLPWFKPIKKEEKCFQV